MSLARKAIVSTAWTSGLNYIGLAVGFVVGIYRDNFLQPAEYGVYSYGIALVDILFIITAFSFNISIVQAPKEDDELYSTGFVLTTILIVVMLFLSGVAAYFLSLRGTVEIKVYAFLVLAAFSSLNLYAMLFSAYLEKQLEYSKIAKVNFLSLLAFPLVSVWLVLEGWGAWALVLGQGSAFTISFIGLYIVSRYPISFRWSATRAKWFLQMGWKLLFSRGLEVLFVRYGNLVTEAMLGTAQQGIYARSLKYWELAPQTVAPAVVTVALPTYSKLQEDNDKLAEAYSLVLFFLTRVLMPFVLVFGLIPHLFVRIIGEQWMGAVPVLRILAIGALLSPMFENMKVLLYSRGRPGDVLKVRVYQLAVFIPAMYFLVKYFGVSGAGLAVVIALAIGVVGTWVKARKIISVRWRTIMLPPILAAAGSVGMYSIYAPRFLQMNVIADFLINAIYVSAVFGIILLALEHRTLKKKYIYLRMTMRKEPGEK